MRNLRNTRHELWQAPSAISALCWDAASDSVLVTQGPSADDVGVRLARVAGSQPLLGQTVAEWEAPSPNLKVAVDGIVDLHHFADTATSCIVFAGGDLVLVREQHDAAAPHIEIVGSIDAGVTAARWAPDEELLFIVTAADTAVFMSRSFDVVAEVTLTADDLRLSKQVSVGWGKKETQFQGKGAKAKTLRDPTIPEKVDEGVLSELDHGGTTVSWRGDGAYVAVNSLQAGVRRVIRVYSREGQLDSVSEPVDGLEGALSWRPAGNLIAGVQRLADGRADVVFFERNGLRHGQFALRVPNDEAGNATRHVSLEWNPLSTVLAVTLADRMQLWTMGNYHWYLKQEVFCGTDRPLLAWHSEKPLTFALATSGALRIEEYVFTVARCLAVPPYDFGTVAVIDGQTVKMTPFRTATIPPPMAMFELELEASALDVAFSPDSSLVAVLHQAGVNLYACESNHSGWVKLRKALFDDKQKTNILQIAFSGLKEVQLLQTGETSKLLTCDLGEQKPEYKESCSSSEAGAIRTIISPVAPGTGGALAQDRSGRFFSYVKGIRENKAFGFSVHLPWAEVWEGGGTSFAFGLSTNGHLYANSRQLVKNCTSFLVTSDHLVFTTTNHVIKFVHLGEVEELEVPPDDPENDERCRNIERGAKLVTAVPTNMNLVLQMPRGNLESIYPRAMVLSGIRQLIEARDYARAFAFCRTQRVDMNLLCDHKPHQFLADVGLFLGHLNHVSHIDLFLSSLREEDVTVALYKDTKPRQAVHPISAHVSNPFSARKSKVNTICDAVLETLLAQKNANLQNIITAHFCKIPPALEDGLVVVAGLLQEDEMLAERAVEHACFLVDVNRIYDQALGLYNLELAMLVAQQSQRDPREYLPLVQRLHQMEPMRRQFTIDDHLGRRDKALRHLRDLGDFSEVKKYTTKYELYATALGLYRHDEQHHNMMTALYAAHLESNSKFGEAGLAYESLGNFLRATACYQQAGTACWRECLFCAQQQDPPPSAESLADLASMLAEALHEAKDHAAVATIHLEYLGSVDAAIRSLCRGYHFADALRLAATQRRPDLLADAVDPGLADAFSTTTEFLADCNAQLRAQVPRIAELRRRAVDDPLAFYEGERDGNVPDHVSVAASSRAASMGTSLMTRYTGHASGSARSSSGSRESRASAKSRRREEKKRARGRKGTVYEEEYLVQSVRRLAERVGTAVPEAERLVFGLARRGMAERARAVEALVADTLKACQTAVAEVWSVGEEGEEKATVGVGMGGGEGVLKSHLESAKIKEEPPVVAKLERLSLLGV